VEQVRPDETKASRDVIDMPQQVKHESVTS
jgi:hypothetical protein